VITTLSHDELVAKLQQVGVPEAAHMVTMTSKPAPLLSLVFNFVRYGVILAAFAVLAHFSSEHFAPMFQFTTMLPNQSPEPTAVGACSSAIAVHAASRRWLSFFR